MKPLNLTPEAEPTWEVSLPAPYGEIHVVLPPISEIYRMRGAALDSAESITDIAQTILNYNKEEIKIEKAFMLRLSYASIVSIVEGFLDFVGEVESSKN